ncbi:MAG: NusA-like transcription termination signal-binding factor [Salinarchaeum sp.]
MSRRLTDAERQHIVLFEDKTGVAPSDCVLDPDRDRIIVVVPPGDMADAIGPDGRAVGRVETAIDATVMVVADADTPEDFVANALAPAAVYDVTIVDDDSEQVAHVEVDPADMGVAIGTDGRTVEAARLLANRHFDIDDVRISASE